MAGTSGCIPDYHVNLFGQLCEPARRPSPSTMTSPNPEPEPQTNIENQTDTAPEPPHTPKDYPAPPHRDPIAELFQKNQDLIRGLSCGDAETYQATLRAVFKEVRESRRRSRAERAERREVGDEGGKVDEDGGCGAGCENRDHVTNGNRFQNEQQVDEEAELEHQHKGQEQDEPQPESHNPEHQTSPNDDQHRNQLEPQPPLQSSHKVPTHGFIITYCP